MTTPDLQRVRPGSTSKPTPQPAPPLISSTSHASLHLLPRRFIGSLPETVIHSDEVLDTKSHLDRVKSKALRHGSKVRQKLRMNDDNSEEDEGDEEDEGVLSKIPRLRHNKPQQRRDVWVGTSFNIGQEFNLRSSPTSAARSASDLPKSTEELADRPYVAPGAPEPTLVDINRDEPPEAGPSQPIRMQTASPPQRPDFASVAKESFHTARTHFPSALSRSPSRTGPVESSPTTQYGDLQLERRTSPEPLQSPHPGEGSCVPAGEQSVRSSSSLTNLNARKMSGNSSTAPLVDQANGDGRRMGLATEPSDIQQKASQHQQLKTSLPKRLKSVLKKSHKDSATLPEDGLGHASSSATDIPARPAKTVQFPVNPTSGLRNPNTAYSSQATLSNGNLTPADPQDVLERSGGEVYGTSAGVVQAATGTTDGLPVEVDDDEEIILPGSVLMRDRMLVRVGYHTESGFQAFDEHTQRKQPCASLQRLEEYIVVWRKGRVELYQEWDTPFKEQIRGTKRLCFVIPLSPTRTTLSIFNSTDLSFTLTTSVQKLAADIDRIERSSTSRSRLARDRLRSSKQVEWLRNRKTGTNIFVFKPTTRSRAVDWYWEIWRELGGELSEFFEVQVPALHTAVRLYLPEDPVIIGSAETCKAFSKSKVIQACIGSLEERVDLGDLQQQHMEGETPLQLELAWRGPEAALDWISDTTTVDGKPRDWAVLAGLALIQHERATYHLQLRQAHHLPHKVQLADRSILREPPAVEGYVNRLKGVAGAKQQVYLATHDGNLFSSTTNFAFPPMPPEEEGSSPRDVFVKAHNIFLHHEQTRASRYIQRAEGFIDFRDIAAIRFCKSSANRSLGPTATRNLQNGGDRAREGNIPHVGHNANQTDEGPVTDGREDDAEHVNQHPGAGSTRFELELRSGQVIRFETRSPEDAAEWVKGLTSLASYWTRRHRLDARLRMDVSSSPNAGLATRASLSRDTDEVDDSLLADVWNWCYIQGCRPSKMAGRLYMKRGHNRQFRSQYVIISGGFLVQFSVKKDAFHARQTRHSLWGAYVYSGLFAAEEVAGHVQEDAWVGEHRVYQDGMIAADGAEDTTFCVRLARKPSRWIGSSSTKTAAWDGRQSLENDEANFVSSTLSKVPATLLIIRTRSKLERDRWVWGINAEIERHMRAHPKSERSLRMSGRVPDR